NRIVTDSRTRSDKSEHDHEEVGSAGDARYPGSRFIPPAVPSRHEGVPPPGLRRPGCLGPESSILAGWPRCLLSADQEWGTLAVASDKKKGRCRLHGGASGSGGPPGECNGQYRHGERTKAAIADRQKFSGYTPQALQTWDIGEIETLRICLIGIYAD